MSHTPEPERTLRSGSVRNPRRRPRESNAESVKSAPRRKRSKIDADTFVPPRMAEEELEVGSGNGSIEVAASPKRGRGRPRKDRGAAVGKGGMVPPQQMEEDKENVGEEVLDGSVARARESEARSTAEMEMPTQMVVRGGRKGSVKRPPRGDGATVLTQNARYAVKLLPSTPLELRRDGVKYRGCLGAAHHALAVTRERAWIWDYTSHAPVNNARVFDVPFPVRKGESLPFGSLVAHGGGSEMGLLLVHAGNGKIVFYESVERAASLGLFQERNIGVEGSIPGLFSGETVTELISAEHAGFIITLSSGRIVQLTLRDAQGKARVFTQFLRATEQSSGGIFGSIKGFLGTSGWKRDVAAVHTRPLGARGQMQVLSLTERAEMQVWDLDWSGQCTFKSTIDFQELIAHETKENESPEMQGTADSFTMLDFAIVGATGGSNMEVATLGTEQPIELLVLMKTGEYGQSSYMLAEVNIEGSSARLGRLLDILTYHPATSDHNKPRLLLPKPQHTAMIVFDDAIVVTSIGEQEGDSPEAQLRASYTPPLTFEDTVFLRHSKGYDVLGACEEDSRGSQASSIAFVQGAGLVRLTALDPEKAPKMARIPVKSKIEQAVFHGSMQDNKILDFGKQGEIEYEAEDIESAALAISDEILRSTSPFITTDPTSIEAHLTHKAQALHALVSHVRQNYPVLSKAAMWQLLWDAERVAAAQVLWTVYEGHVAAVSKKKRTSTVLDEVCRMIEEDLHKGADEEAKSSAEDVHNFFIYGLHHLERIFTWSRNFLKMVAEDDSPSEVTLRLVTEANDIWNKALEAVFSFRAENAATYGILAEFIEDGVLVDASEYAELPEFWTSTKQMLKSADEICKLSRALADGEWDKCGNDSEQLELLHPVVQNVCMENPGLVQLLCNIYQERIHWLASRASFKDRELAEKLRENYDATREDEFRALAGIAQTEAGLKLAERYRDMHTLTVLIVGEVQFCLSTLATATNEERDAIGAQLDEMTKRIGKYFERFGDDWANAYFDEGFSGSRAGMMLRDAQVHWQDALSRYLQADPSRARICWIDDVTARKDYAHAGQCLLTSGREQESKLWNKKVELAMAKLASMATQEAGEEATAQRIDSAAPDNDLTVVGIQERLYQNILPEVLHCIDKQAELEVAMQKYVHKNQDLHALRSLLETCMERILEHEVLEPVDLIDVLGLIDSTDSSDGLDEDVILNGSEFYLALRVLNAIAPSLKQDQFETTLQLLWKRCYVYDSEIWNTINADSKRASDDTKEILRHTAPWRTLEFALEDGFFDDPNCAVRFLSPSECLGAGCRAEDLTWRWESTDLLDPILADNRTHDEQLQDLIASQRLDAWVQSCFDGAKEAVSERAEDKAAALLTEREFEEAYVERDTNGVANGVLNGIKSEAYFEDVDGEFEESENGVEESAEFDDEQRGEDADADEDGDVEMG